MLDRKSCPKHDFQVGSNIYSSACGGVLVVCCGALARDASPGAMPRKQSGLATSRRRADGLPAEGIRGIR